MSRQQKDSGEGQGRPPGPGRSSSSPAANSPVMAPIKGRVWLFGDDISTDVLSPAAYLYASPEVRRQHVLEAVDPRFPLEVKPGDVIVAGRNFGCGSSRESAPENLRLVGIGCVVAESFARIFARNAVAIGLPAVACPGVSKVFQPGDELELDLEAATVRNCRTGEVLAAERLAPEMIQVLARGGILPLLRELSASGLL